MSEIQFQKTPYGIAASLVDGEKITFGVGRTHAEAEENLREKLSEPFPESEAAPASEARAPSVPHYRTNGGGVPARSGIGFPGTPSDPLAEIASLRAELTKLRARVAILDAQKVELPRLVEDEPPVDEDVVQSYYLEQRERQLLDALRAIQVWREVAHRQHDALRDVLRGNDLAAERRQSIENWPGSDFRGLGYAAVAAYDALVGKGE